MSTEELVPESETPTRYVITVQSVCDVIVRRQDWRILEKKSDGSEPRGHVTVATPEVRTRIISNAEVMTRPSLAALVAAIGDGT